MEPVEFVTHLRLQGVSVVASDAFTVTAPAPEAMPVCLGGQATREECRHNLGVIEDALERFPALTSRVMWRRFWGAPARTARSVQAGGRGNIHADETPEDSPAHLRAQTTCRNPPCSSVMGPGAHFFCALNQWSNAMHYMILQWEHPDDAARRDGPDAAAYWGGWTAYAQAVAGAGVMVSGNGLQAPHTATTVRLRDGRRQVQDGPYADTKEQLGGYFIIDVPSLDAALEWAARSPCVALGSVEVRPVLAPPAG